MQTLSPDPLIRDEDIAAILGCSTATVWRRVADGTLPAPVRLVGLSRWPRSEILAVIETAKAQRDAAAPGSAAVSVPSAKEGV